MGPISRQLMRSVKLAQTTTGNSQPAGDLSNNTSTYANDLTKSDSLPRNKVNPFGPVGLNLFGQKRAIIGAKFLAPKDTTPPFPTCH